MSYDIRKRFGGIGLCVETPFSSFRWRASAAPADAGKTAVRILRFDAAAASTSATNKRRPEFPACFFLTRRANPDGAKQIELG
jgi:hypothetical protein